jgi:hypothetical protein
MHDKRDSLYLALIGEAISDIRRRFSDAAYDRFLSDRDEQALASFGSRLSAKLQTSCRLVFGPDIRAFRGQVWLLFATSCRTSITASMLLWRGKVYTPSTTSKRW